MARVAYQGGVASRVSMPLVTVQKAVIYAAGIPSNGDCHGQSCRRREEERAHEPWTRGLDEHQAARVIRSLSTEFSPFATVA